MYCRRECSPVGTLTARNHLVRVTISSICNIDGEKHAALDIQPAKQKADSWELGQLMCGNRHFVAKHGARKSREANEREARQ